jgi:hypothetical protein
MKSIKSYLSILLVSISTIGISQDYMLMDSAEVMESIKYWQVDSMGPGINILDTADGITFQTMGFYKVRESVSFDYDNVCDSINIKISCTKCVHKVINSILENKERKWVKNSDSSYISPNWTSKSIPNVGGTTYEVVKMTISKIDREEFCVKVILNLVTISKEERKSIKKKGKKGVELVPEN